MPTNTISGAGELFLLSYSGTTPGAYPRFFAGTNVFWNNAVLGNPVAVLVQDATGNEYMVAFGQEALLLDSLLFFRKTKEDKAMML